MKKLTLLLLLTFPLIVTAQDCDCESNFNWMKKTFEENDAGFAYTIEKKTELAYQIHNQKFEEKIGKIKNLNECYQALYEWLTFFRSGHIGIQPIPQDNATNQEIDSETIKAGFKDWEKLEVDDKAFTTYLKSKNSTDYEGIWWSEPYEIGVKKVGDEYVGFIIKADDIYWTEGQVKFRIHADNTATYYMKDHSARSFENAELLGNNFLEMGFITLKRTFPEFDNAPKLERYFRVMEAQKPFFESIDEHTVMLRIPGFDGAMRNEIDSLIAAHKKEILSTPNLIIDLRNNGGGSDQSYYELLPIIYTDTIRSVGVQFLSTPLNNKRMLDFIESTEYGFDDNEKEEFRVDYEKLSKHLGEFVNLDPAIVEKVSYDTIYRYPQRVGIIIHGENASTTEQFLLAAKQSKKVKLFGTRTSGALDVSNMQGVPSPSNEFKLWYCLSKSYRIPDMAIDEVGIQPDYYLNKEIPKYEWINFVKEVLND